MDPGNYILKQYYEGSLFAPTGPSFEFLEFMYGHFCLSFSASPNLQDPLVVPVTKTGKKETIIYLFTLIKYVLIL